MPTSCADCLEILGSTLRPACIGVALPLLYTSDKNDGVMMIMMINTTKKFQNKYRKRSD